MKINDEHLDHILRLQNFVEFLEVDELIWGEVKLSGFYRPIFYTEVRDFSDPLLVAKPCF